MPNSHKINPKEYLAVIFDKYLNFILEICMSINDKIYKLKKQKNETYK